MFAKLKEFLNGASEAEGKPAHSHSIDEKHLAAAVLLVEASLQDDHNTAEETDTMISILQRYLKLAEDEAKDLLEVARKEQDEAIQLHRFTRSVKDLYPFEERVEMIEMLWEVAYSDGELHNREEALVRKVAGLIYVSDRDRGEARKRVLKRLNLKEA